MKPCDKHTVGGRDPPNQSGPVHESAPGTACGALVPGAGDAVIDVLEFECQGRFALPLGCVRRAVMSAQPFNEVKVELG